MPNEAGIEACAKIAFYIDADGDGHGAIIPIEACEPPPGAVASHDDCDDTDANTYPGQPNYFTMPRLSGGYDYDCDGKESSEFELASCTQPGNGICTGTSGYVSTIIDGVAEGVAPACGGMGAFAACAQEQCVNAGSGCEGVACVMGDANALPQPVQGCR